jgi:hypothetical protein
MRCFIKKRTEVRLDDMIGVCGCGTRLRGCLHDGILVAHARAARRQPEMVREYVATIFFGQDLGRTHWAMPLTPGRPRSCRRDSFWAAGTCAEKAQIGGYEMFGEGRLEAFRSVGAY